MAGLMGWLRPKSAEVRITVDKKPVDEAALAARIGRMSAAQQRQYAEVLGKVRELSSERPFTLALEAILTRYVPRAPIASNVLMFDSEKYWKRVECLDEAREHVDGLLATAPAPQPQPGAAELPADVVTLFRERKRICWLLGAGVSVAAGIPSYRGTGAYDDVKAQRARSMDFYLRHSDISWIHADALKRFLSTR